MNQHDVIIIGAGIVGLSTAYSLIGSNRNLEIVIIDKEAQIAQHQTGHNSGVIHSGVYYRPESAKALNCKKGYELLLDFCAENNVNHEICGKIIVATHDTEVPALRKIFQNGQANRIEGIRMLNSQEVQEIEPNVAAIEGIHVPTAGIINYKEVAHKICDNIVDHGVQMRLGESVHKIIVEKNKNRVETTNDVYEAKLVINCAGLYSDKIANLTEGSPEISILPFRGEYYTLKDSKKHLVKNLVYPVPNPQFPFLGVHFTRTIGGDIEAGPNAVLAFCREGYNKRDIKIRELWETLSYPGFRCIAKKYWREGAKEMFRSYSRKAFVNSLQKLIPSISSQDIVRGGSGVRAQACSREGVLIDDFLVKQNKGIINVCNAPSPAATSCFAIGSNISTLALKN